MQSPQIKLNRNFFSNLNDLKYIAKKNISIGSAFFFKILSFYFFFFFNGISTFSGYLMPKLSL